MREILEFVREVIEFEHVNKLMLIELQKRLTEKSEKVGLAIEELEILNLLGEKTGIKMKVDNNGDVIIVECKEFDYGKWRPDDEDIESDGCCAYCKRICDCEVWIEVLYGGHTNFFMERNFKR